MIDLDEGVVQALDFFSVNKISKRKKIGPFRKPLVVGSGNAEIVGSILFSDTEAILANESNFVQKYKINKGIDGAILISASGGKSAPRIAKKLKKMGLGTVLFTTNENAIAKKYVQKMVIFPKIKEPYTYNISTYLSMILAKTGEDPSKILSFIQKNYKKIPKNLSKYDAYFILVPDKFEIVSGMIQTKFEELFGPKISARILTEEHAKHAETVVGSNTELFVGLGVKNTKFGKNRLNLPISKDFGYAAFISWAYYFVGKIQKQNPAYFKRNIDSYVKRASKMFGQKIKKVVD